MKNKSKYKTHKRIFLVVADNTSEMHQALYYAARRAATANGEVALFRNNIVLRQADLRDSRDLIYKEIYY